jgi:uncharacterized protein with PQ loop repeat
MNISAIIVLLGTLIGLVRALPQLIGLLRAKKAAGVSVDTAATSAIVGFGWATYGLITHQPYVALATGASATVFLIITFSALGFGRRIKELKVTPIWLCVLLIAGIAAKDKGLGVILPVSVLIANLPQLRVAYKRRTCLIFPLEPGCCPCQMALCGGCTH